MHTSDAGRKCIDSDEIGLSGEFWEGHLNPRPAGHPDHHPRPHLSPPPDILSVQRAQDHGPLPCEPPGPALPRCPCPSKHGHEHAIDWVAGRAGVGVRVDHARICNKTVTQPSAI